MPIHLSDLKAKRRTIPITYLDETGEATYLPGEITEQMFSDMRAAQEAGDENTLNTLLSTLVYSWDVVDEAGKMIPLKNSHGPAPELSGLPIPFKSAVLTQVMEDILPNRPSANTSGATSSRKAK
jgi:hypothetical protein